jgi:photosystem II stability/assembly factor-like uncharacterized protein
MQQQRRLVVLGIVVASLGLSAPASAGIWTPIASNTTDTITALDNQGAGRLLYTTSAGKIFKNGTQVGNFPGVPLNDIAMSPDGTKGVAVGDGGKLYRSSNSGDTWTAVAGLQTRPPSCPGTPVSPVALTDSLVAVAWADNVTAYATAVPGASDNNSPIQKSTNGGANWTEVNRLADGTCRIHDVLTDVKAIPGSTSLYLLGRDFGDIYFSSDGLASSAAHRSEAVNCFGKRPRLGLDEADPNRLFATDQCTGSLSLEFSSDGGSSFAALKYPNSSDDLPGLFDTDVNGGTMLAVGNAGGIYNSLDGRNAYAQTADGALATRDWRAVGLSSATDAIVAGTGGAMAATSSANAIPDLIPPAGSITGPTTATAGTPVSYTAAVADNAGGSGIDPNGFAWSAPGLPAAAGNPVSVTFPSAGFYSLHVAFRDLAGNAGEATLSVTVGAAAPAPKPPTTTTVPVGKTTTASVPGAKITFATPKACVAPGAKFRVTLSFKRQKRKGSRFVKVSRTDFYIGSTRVKIDRKAPFVDTLTVTAGTKPGSTIKLRARAYIKVRHGKAPTKSITTKLLVCG